MNGSSGGRASCTIQPHDLSDHVAHAREQFSADVFDFFGREAANFFDDGQGQSEDRRAAADEQRLRDDERERNFHGEAGAAARLGTNFNFAVQRVNVCAHDVQADAAPC